MEDDDDVGNTGAVAAMDKEKSADTSANPEPPQKRQRLSL